MHLFEPIAWLLQQFYQVVPDYAAAITGLTLLVMIVLTPLTLKGTRSIMQMQALQPEIKKLQVQFKDDRQRLNEETMRFYKEHNLSPLGGCLPMFIQMPIYFILYRVLRGLTNKSNGTFAPKYLSDHTSKLYVSLHGHTSMKSLGIDLADNAKNVLSKQGLGHALPYVVLIVLVAASTYVQQKQISARTPTTAQANPMSQSMLRIMPAIMGIICLQLPGALVLYMFVSNLYRVGQQQLISHAIYKPAAKAGLFDKAIEAKAAEAGKPAASKGFLASLLGDAAPRVGKNAEHGFNDGGGSPSTTKTRAGGSNGTRANGSKGSVSKANGSKSNGSGSTGTKKPVSGPGGAAKAPQPPRPSGRATPAGSRPNGAGRKKKRR